MSHGVSIIFFFGISIILKFENIIIATVCMLDSISKPKNSVIDEDEGRSTCDACSPKTLNMALILIIIDDLVW